MKTEDLTPEIKWCLKNAKVLQEHNGPKDQCKDVELVITQPAMKSRLMQFFFKNHDFYSHGRYGVYIGQGSINIHIPRVGDHGTIKFSACIGNDIFSSIEN